MKFKIDFGVWIAYINSDQASQRLHLAEQMKVLSFPNPVVKHGR